jgi:DNA-binding CsgD family transcriptional regulator
MLGGVQRRLKQRAAARATLSEAAGIFERAGAVLWAARARAELTWVSGRRPEPDDLTASELRVAGLIAGGLSNKEAAAELFVTVRAVESTLTKAYAKLGVRSRTELAARLHAMAADAGPLRPSHLRAAGRELLCPVPGGLSSPGHHGRGTSRAGIRPGRRSARDSLTGARPASPGSTIANGGVALGALLVLIGSCVSSVNVETQDISAATGPARDPLLM